MAQLRPTIPLTIIAGYLGSGKTTLLNHLIAQCDTSRFAILVNDFGKLNIDAELVELEGGKAYRLESGCICCNIGNSLMTTLLELLRIDPRPERILIEASGVADPARIADIAHLSPSLHPGRIIVLIDSTRVRCLLADPLVGETARKQIEAADLLVLNKADLVPQDALIELSVWLRSQFGQRPSLTAKHAHIPVTEILTDRDSPNRRGEDNRQAAQATAHDHHDHASAPVQHPDVFWSWSYESSALFVREGLEEALREMAPIVERAKGFVRFRAAPHRIMVVQLAGAKYSITEAHQDVSTMPNCRIELIGIGKKPDETTLRNIIDRARDPVPTAAQ